MSTTALVKFRDGIASEWQEFPNSWGGAAAIWDAMFEAYIPKTSEFDNWMKAAQDRRLWALSRSDLLLCFERSVFLFSLDYAYVSREHFCQFAADLKAFSDRHARANRVNHLAAWAEVFHESNFDAIALYATSVGDDPWSYWEEDDGPLPYDMNVRDDHWEIFERLAAIGKFSNG